MPSARSAITLDTAPATLAVDELSDHLDLLAQVERKLKKLTILRSDLRLRFKTTLGAFEIGTINDIPVVSFEHGSRSVVLPHLVRQLHPEVVADCTRVIPVRPFLLLS